MTTAFVLINSEIAAEDGVLKKLRGIKEVKEAYIVYGVYDIIARIESKDMESLRKLITWRIRQIDKVRSTLTMVVSESI